MPVRKYAACYTHIGSTCTCHKTALSNNNSKNNNNCFFLTQPHSTVLIGLYKKLNSGLPNNSSDADAHHMYEDYKQKETAVYWKLPFSTLNVGRY